MDRAFASISQGACIHPVSMAAWIALGVVIAACKMVAFGARLSQNWGPSMESQGEDRPSRQRPGGEGSPLGAVAF